MLPLQKRKLQEEQKKKDDGEKNVEAIKRSLLLSLLFLSGQKL